MTQEEKAKAYDEALERARKIHDQILNNELIGFPDQIREIFPQLRESEDEKIIDTLIWLVEGRKKNRTTAYGDVKIDDILAWLEKQKEQEGMITVSKEAWDENAKDSFERGIKVGMIRQQKEQWLTAKINGEPIPTENYSVNIPLAEWSEEDKKMFNTLVDYVEYPSCWNLKCPREKLVAFIKSLRPSWKPNEEELNLLRYLAKGLDVASHERHVLDNMIGKLTRL